MLERGYAGIEVFATRVGQVVFSENCRWRRRFSMALRSIAADLVRLLDAASGPVYVLDDQRRILFLNDACAAWPAAGRASWLRQSRVITRAPKSRARPRLPPLCRRRRKCEPVKGPRRSSRWPDPMAVSPHGAWNSCHSAATRSTWQASWLLPRRTVWTLPGRRPMSRQPTTRIRRAELHHRLAEWRRKLVGHCHTDRLVGDSPAIRQVAQAGRAGRDEHGNRVDRRTRGEWPAARSASDSLQRARNRLGRSCRSPVRCWQ